MKLLYFTRDYNTHDRRFLAALARTDHQVYYLRLERRGHPLEDRPLPSQIEQVHWAGGQRPARLSDGPRLLLDLKRVIRTVRPDLIQCGPLQTCAFLVALSGFHPLLSMSWGYDLLHDAYRSALWRWATRYTLSHSDGLLGDCDTIRQRAISFGMRPGGIVYFPWGVDLQHYSAGTPRNSRSTSASAEDRPSSADVFTLLSTRGWESIYGVDVLARAFVNAARRCTARGGPQLRLLMLGAGSQAAALRQTFLQGGVIDQVIFPGQVGQADLPRYYRLADLYVSASHSDGSSISLLEAMACAKPALVSDIPGNREWVEPGVHGWWFVDGDDRALESAILRAVDERCRLPEMGRAARRLVEGRADWEVNFPKLLAFYKDLTGF